MTRRRGPSSAKAVAGASDDRTRAKNDVTSGRRHRAIAAQNVFHTADLLMSLSSGLSAGAVGLLIVGLAGGQVKCRRYTRMVGWPQARARAVGRVVSDEVDI